MSINLIIKRHTGNTHADIRILGISTAATKPYQIPRSNIVIAKLILP